MNILIYSLNSVRLCMFLLPRSILFCNLGCYFACFISIWHYKCLNFLQIVFRTIKYSKIKKKIHIKSLENNLYAFSLYPKHWTDPKHFWYMGRLCSLLGIYGFNLRNQYCQSFIKYNISNYALCCLYPQQSFHVATWTGDRGNPGTAITPIITVVNLL